MILEYEKQIISKGAKKYPTKDPFVEQIILLAPSNSEICQILPDIYLVLITKDKAKTKEIFQEFGIEFFIETSIILKARYFTPEEYARTEEPVVSIINELGETLWQKEFQSQ